MAPNKKVNVKERYTDGEIDLSMSDLQEVPVKEIALLKKTTALDLSNNSLTSLPPNFTILVNLTKLDLSKNELKELPEDFGNLSRLKYLDLYKNKLEHLPLSFSKLKDLRFLDLKDNPLVPTVAKVAGPCLDTKECQKCAKDIVIFFTKLQQQIDSEVEMRNKSRRKQLELNQQKRQEEKKVKKIEQQKRKQEQVEVQTKNIGKKNKKDKKGKNLINMDKNRKNSTSCSMLNILLLLIILSFITILMLFILTSVNYKHTQAVEALTKQVYFCLTDKLPPNLQEYSVKTAVFVKSAHEKTGNVTLEIVENLGLQEKLSNISVLLINGYNYLLEKATDVYNNFVRTNN